MQDINLHHITTDRLSSSFLDEKKISVDVLRLDKIHPLVSGNKWFKLRYYLEQAATTRKKRIVTWGGAWSNHILATAAACNLHRLPCSGIIRGEESTTLSSTLVTARELGMQLLFISRDDYRYKRIPADLAMEDNFFIPEGGYGTTGAKGAATIADQYNQEDYTHTCCAAGTGTMSAGLIRAALSGKKIVAVSVLKNNWALEDHILQLAENKTGFLQLLHDYHFGGYANYQPELIAYMNDFYTQTNIPSDFVYTGKLFFACNDLIRNNFFPPGSKLLIIHSGGLQGNTSLNKGTLIF
ncbi:MAG: pyridoxal-phosphate dependent enzyme [Bacteroidota bacterium]|nr:pyridoxal-phosphate dependent enzyme [Bacteroidota bacterium]